MTSGQPDCGLDLTDAEREDAAREAEPRCDVCGERNCEDPECLDIASQPTVAELAEDLAKGAPQWEGA